MRLGVYVITVCRKENQMSSYDVGFTFPLDLNILKTKQCTKIPKTLSFIVYLTMYVVLAKTYDSNITVN